MPGLSNDSPGRFAVKEASVLNTSVNRFAAGLFMAATAFSASALELDVVETSDLRLIYLDPFQTHLVPHVTRNFHNSLEFQKETFGWEPHENATVFLTDLSDYGGAGAWSVPRNGVSVSIAPFSRTLETMPASERFFMLMNHELVHLANVDVANEQDRGWRRFFGGKPSQTDEHPESILYTYLTAPRRAAPRWYFEGAAVFMETWMSGGLGRAQGGYDEMVFRAMVRDDAHFYTDLGIVSEGVSVDFQTGVNAYLYGTRFMSYLAYEYSPDQVVEWLSRNEDSERYYSRQFEKVFQRPLSQGWQEWIQWEREFQQKNLESVRRHPLTPTRPLTQRTLGSVSKSYLTRDGRSLVGAFRYPGVVAHVGVLSLETDDLKHVADIKGPMKYRVASTAWDPDTETLFYTADNVAYRDLMAVDVRSGKTEMLIRDARIGDIVFNPADRSIWGLRHENGLVSLVRVPYPYQEWNLLYAWPYGHAAYEMDISPDGTLLSASLGNVDGSQYHGIFNTADLLAGKAEPIKRFDFGQATPEGFVFSRDGRFLFGSSFYTGVSNIFRYEIATGEIEAVSNAETGFFRPIEMPDGNLMVFDYSGQGFVPTLIDPIPLQNVGAISFLGTEIARKHPVVRDWNVVRSLRQMDADKLIVREGKYRPIRELEYDSGYPVIEGYRDFESLGYHFQFSDPAGLSRVLLTAGYSWDNDLPSDERFHLNLEYRGINWSARYWHNDADFYDLFGPKERSRKGDAFIVGYDRTLIFDDPRTLDFSAELAYFTGLDTLPNNQNVSTVFFDEILSLDLGLHYSHTRKSLGAVDHEKGFRWEAILSVDDSDLDTAVKPHLGFDFGLALPLKHSSVWFYNSVGYTDGDRDDPLSNFYFGGFGNNYVDDGDVKRYRKYYSMPGFELDEIAAQDFVKTVVEWNLPPIRFREAGTPGLFLSHARPALFLAGLKADPGDDLERSLISAGFQVDFAFTLTHRLPMTLSLGYAIGREGGKKRDDEWLVSLKIL